MYWRKAKTDDTQQTASRELCFTFEESEGGVCIYRNVHLGLPAGL